MENHPVRGIDWYGVAVHRNRLGEGQGSHPGRRPDQAEGSEFIFSACDANFMSLVSRKNLGRK